jgi:hypothetical protein
MLDFKSLIPTFSQREKELFVFIEVTLNIRVNKSILRIADARAGWV